MPAAPLTPEQQRAVESDAHALEIRAGAGTGKTHTLTHRVARFAPTHVAQARLLVVTFTREATASLDRRLSILLGRDHAVRVGSFHQWAARELPPHERVFLGEGEARRIVAEALRRAGAGGGFLRALGVAPGGDDAAARVLGFLSFLKNTESTVGAAVSGPFSQLASWEDILDGLRLAYEEKKGDRKDYDDLLVAFRDRLRRSSSFRREVAQRVDHLFVDEYQDVNRLQADAVRLVTTGPDAPRVSVVGDPRQSIYGFRGGSPRHLESFLDAYGARGERRALTQNFRSTRRVLEAANRLLPDEYPLRPRPRALPGPLVEARACPDAESEARILADHVEALLAKGAQPADVVVLARARHLAGAYQLEVASRAAAEAWAALHSDAMTEAVERVHARIPFPDRGDLARAGEILLRRLRVAPPKRRDVASLVALPTGAALREVGIATIHAAKGLEWDHVVLLGAREGGLPSDYARNAAEDVRDELLEEERRLLYVALTRARKSFLATWPEEGGRRTYEPCRWLSTITNHAAPPAAVAARARGRAKADA